MTMQMARGESYDMATSIAQQNRTEFALEGKASVRSAGLPEFTGERVIPGLVDGICE